MTGKRDTAGKSDTAGKGESGRARRAKGSVRDAIAKLIGDPAIEQPGEQPAGEERETDAGGGLTAGSADTVPRSSPMPVPTKPLPKSGPKSGPKAEPKSGSHPRPAAKSTRRSTGAE